MRQLLKRVKARIAHQRGWIVFPESALAHRYLDGLHGIEVGASAHNAFGLDTINVDFSSDMNTEFKQLERSMCGSAARVDVVANGDVLPFRDKSVDFVLSSHVIEHFHDPIKALREWQRIATTYLFIIFPNRERTFDRGKPLTSLQELIDRHAVRSAPILTPTDHKSIWVQENFMELMDYMKYDVVEIEDPDRKVGNGTAVVVRLH